MRKTTCRKVTFVVIAVFFAYRASLQIAMAQGSERPTALQWKAAKLSEKALQKENPPTQTSVDLGKRVVLNIDHAQLSDLSGDPCFRIALRTWGANGAISIQLIGPKGEIVPVVPTEQPIHASPEGSAAVTVPYKHRDLYPGLWLLMVSGPAGIHECKVEIPKVLPRDGNRKEERLVFKTRNTLSSSLPYHFGVYEPPAQRPGHQNAIDLQQKEADLNRRAAELEKRAAELEKKAAPAAAPSTAPATRPTGQEAPPDFIKLIESAPDFSKMDQYEKDKVYSITGKFAPYFQILQVTSEFILIVDARSSGFDSIALLIPENPKALESVNIATKQGGNPAQYLARAPGAFAGFKEIETRGGIKRLPTFIIPGLNFYLGKFISLK